MQFGKKFIMALLCMFIFVGFIGTAQANKSVFIISKHGSPSHAQAYAIDGNEVTYQADVDISTLNPGAGPVGNAVWPEKELMFVTYEGSPTIVWASTKTLQKVGELDTGVSNLAGIVVDEGNEKIYVVRRYSTELYVYSWDDVKDTIVLEEPNDPNYPARKYHPLTNTTNAHGIALDEYNNLLYITDSSKTVRVYDTSDWSHDHSIDISVSGIDRSAVGIAVDPTNGYLYTGHWEYHNYLVRTDTASPYTSTEVEITRQGYSPKQVIGVDVDDDTGLVYITTYHHDFRVYDSNLVLKDTERNADIYGPGGVAVGGLYKPHVFDVNKVDNVNDVDCVYPWNIIEENYLVYNICYDANGYADTNVVITDYLPAEVEYYSSSSDPCGVYHPDSNTVTWDINDISGADSNCLELTVKVKQSARPGKKIINFCVMEGDLYYKSTTIVTDICCYGGDIIYVDKDANGYNIGTSWQNAYPDLQDALTDANDCDCEQIRVAQQTYKPTDTNERSISFEMVDDVAVYGGFPPGGGEWVERDPNAYETILSGDIAAPNNQSDNSYHVVKCEDVNNAILDGFTITGGNAKGSVYNEWYGGGVYCQDSTNLTLTDCNISDNTAYHGGGMYNQCSSASLINCIFTDNTVNYNGGGIYNDQSSPKLINCTFTANKSTSSSTSVYYHGGAIFNTNSSDPNMSNCAFSNNSAREGGAVCNNYSKPNITHCIFSGNEADYYGGGISNEYSSGPNVTNCIFSNNSSVEGGAVYNYSSSPNITNCIFTGNIVDSSGGGMHNKYYSSVAVANCTFINNSAAEGGAVYNDYSNPNITNCIFTGNKVNDYGGGMHNYQSSPVVVSSIFSGNRADSYGGGVANYYNSSPLLTNCTFSGNSAWYGGGICSWNYVDTNVTNCIFWGNDANALGGEIYNDDVTSNLNVTYCDVNGGWVGEGNIDADPCFFDVSALNGLWAENASYDSSTFQSTLTDYSANWVVNGLAGKFVNPDTPNQYLQFFIVSNDVNTIKVWSNVESIALTGKTYQIYDYHLTADSNCIDAGDPDFNPDANMTDIDGERRVVDGDANGTEIVDMGADEYYRSPADFNSDGIVNFFDYALFANFWQTTSDVYDLIDDNNYIDYNDLARFCEDWLWQRAWAKAFPYSYGQGMGKSMGLGMSESLGLAEEILPSAPAKKPQPEVTKADIVELIKWLEELWLTDAEVRKMISEDEWLKFMESVIQAIKEKM